MNQIFDHDVTTNPDAATRIEWLETDGRGGYASDTILNCHTRKYHGLLVAPALELDAKFVFLSKLETTLTADGKTVELSTNRYPDAIHPQGYRVQSQFRQDLWPSVTWEVAGVVLKRSVMMLPGEHTTLIRYDLIQSPTPVTLRLSPLLAYRNMHTLTRENSALNPGVAIETAGLRLQPYADMPALYLHGSTPPRFTEDPVWNYNLEYTKEAARGFDHHEDLFRPGYFTVKLEEGVPFVMRASLGSPISDCLQDWEREKVRRCKSRQALTGDDTMKALKIAAQQFVITNPRGRRSVVAGYPWFAEWGRDAMIALPGLTLYADRPKDALAVLKTFMDHRRDGLVPNYLGVDKRGDSYNAVDASLWLFWAIQEYWHVTGDRAGVQRELLDGMRDILTSFAAGTVPHVSPRDDGLIDVGSVHTQLTWMDATVHGQPVTPRHGLAIDLCALWYNALCFFDEVCETLGVVGEPDLSRRARRAKKSLVAQFWLPEGGYLADVVNADGVDGAIRPNQCFAISLPHSALTRKQMQSAVDVVTRELATPYGMRTLATGHWAYRGYYGGTGEERDGAYHQGTVWPWLMGHYVAARLRAAPSAKARKTAALAMRELFNPLYTSHLRDAGVNTISEIMSAEEPYEPDGCIAQAWSVAEAIRARALIDGALA